MDVNVAARGAIPAVRAIVLCLEITNDSCLSGLPLVPGMRRAANGQDDARFRPPKTAPAPAAGAGEVDVTAKMPVAYVTYWPVTLWSPAPDNDSVRQDAARPALVAGPLGACDFR